MKASIRSKYGLPDVLSLQEVTIPQPRDNEILVKVHAATVNRTDCAILTGKPFIMRFFTGLFKPIFASTGTDFAGIIEAVGKYVSNFRVGDRVFGFNDRGMQSHAQYIVVVENAPVFTIPDAITYEQAAASCEGAHYAYNFINKVDIKNGDSVLVNGSTGAIGSAALQLLKYVGASVTAICHSKNIELVRTLGADKLIDYSTEDFTTDTQKYHYIFDTVGKSTFAKCKSLLHPGGVYMSSELGPWWQNIYLPLITRIWGTKRVVFPVPMGIHKSLSMIRDLLEAGKFQPLIDRKYPLENIAEAYKYVASGQKIGNVMLTFGHNE